MCLAFRVTKVLRKPIRRTYSILNKLKLRRVGRKSKEEIGEIFPFIGAIMTGLDEKFEQNV